MVLKTIFGKIFLFLILTLFGHFWPFWPFLAFCDFFAVIIIGYFSRLLSKKNSLIFMRLRMVLKIIFGKMPHLFWPFWGFTKIELLPFFLLLILAFLAFKGLLSKKNFLSLMRLRMVLKTTFGKMLLFLILTLFGHFWPFWPFLAFYVFFLPRLFFLSGLLSKKNSLSLMKLRMVLKTIFGKMLRLERFTKEFDIT